MEPCIGLSLVLLCFLVSGTISVDLDSYNVDKSQVSVSGFSSGAAMATQFHVAHSRDVMGVGIVAGVPYLCAEGNEAMSFTCMLYPNQVQVSTLHTLTASTALFGNIDSTSHISNDKVWIFAGAEDSIIKPTAGVKVRDFYSYYIHSSGSIRTVFKAQAEHCMPTDGYGGRCDKLNEPSYINNCNYDAAYEMLDFIYGGNLNPPSAAVGSLIQFDQGDFFRLSLPIVYSMDSKGFVYVPSGCLSKTTGTACKLHIAFHGCQMERSRIGEEYVRHAGYNEVGEANNIIILYPQIHSNVANPQGCWDWWGYTGSYYATTSGFQMTAVYRMMKRILG